MHLISAIGESFLPTLSTSFSGVKTRAAVFLTESAAVQANSGSRLTGTVERVNQCPPRLVWDRFQIVVSAKVSTESWVVRSEVRTKFPGSPLVRTVVSNHCAHKKFRLQSEHLLYDTSICCPVK